MCQTENFHGEYNCGLIAKLSVHDSVQAEEMKSNLEKKIVQKWVKPLSALDVNSKFFLKKRSLALYSWDFFTW